MYKSAVFLSSSRIELAARRSQVLDGRTLNEHISTCCATSWRVWPMPSALVSRMAEDPALYYIGIEQRHLHAIGVDADIVADIGEAVPELSAMDGPGATEPSSTQVPAQAAHVSNSASSSTPAVKTESDRVLERLHGIAVSREGVS